MAIADQREQAPLGAGACRQKDLKAGKKGSNDKRIKITRNVRKTWTIELPSCVVGWLQKKRASKGKKPQEGLNL